MHPKSEDSLIVALDVASPTAAQKIVSVLGESVHIYKVGMQLYTAAGPPVVRDLVSCGKQVFLDLKYHDIPNTVASAVREASQLGVSMLTVHASGGERMLRAAAEAARAEGGVLAHQSSLQILAVTVLTSMDETDLHQTGVSGALLEQVLRLASTALRAGCAGVVSSAREVRALRAQLGQDFMIVNPGVRPDGADHGDQARVVTPSEAVQAGATHIVVGRPITAAKDPAAAARAIQQEISAAAEASKHSSVQLTSSH